MPADERTQSVRAVFGKNSTTDCTDSTDRMWRSSYEQPDRLFPTATISSPIATVPSWLLSTASQDVSGDCPNAIRTARMSSLMLTDPPASQSPPQTLGIDVGVARGGVTVGVAAA